MLGGLIDVGIESPVGFIDRLVKERVHINDVVSGK
jgi:hypothetical protein